jgi:hypothetical protein
MNSKSPEILTTTPRRIDSSKNDCSYTKSFSDIPVANSTANEKFGANIPARATSASPAPFPVIFEIPTNTINSIKSTGAPPSTCSSFHSHHPHRRSTGLGTFERQLSLLDPMSDRVSTILVWQHLTVQIREDKRKEAFQRMKSYKTFVPKRKCLLNNISGAITGGLWAVMGKFYILQRIYLMNVLYK